mmetsp:Transcript_6278/g.16017  ORF Transcript_6278/g.16017 Transcript_6278/m.16017 type:complete len:481 (-) Transcript_6278:354-1796(-)
MLFHQLRFKRAVPSDRFLANAAANHIARWWLGRRDALSQSQQQAMCPKIKAALPIALRGSMLLRTCRREEYLDLFVALRTNFQQQRPIRHQAPQVRATNSQRAPQALCGHGSELVATFQAECGIFKPRLWQGFKVMVARARQGALHFRDALLIEFFGSRQVPLGDRVLCASQKNAQGLAELSRNLVGRLRPALHTLSTALGRFHALVEAAVHHAHDSGVYIAQKHIALGAGLRPCLADELAYGMLELFADLRVCPAHVQLEKQTGTHSAVVFLGIFFLFDRGWRLRHSMLPCQSYVLAHSQILVGDHVGDLGHLLLKHCFPGLRPHASRRAWLDQLGQRSQNGAGRRRARSERRSDSSQRTNLNGWRCHRCSLGFHFNWGLLGFLCLPASWLLLPWRLGLLRRCRGRLRVRQLHCHLPAQAVLCAAWFSGGLEGKSPERGVVERRWRVFSLRVDRGVGKLQSNLQIAPLALLGQLFGDAT